ncbi:MAG: phenylacetic acid degradation protein [Elusimicrobia bacterium RIFOXYB2_FULL_49_7]|nr:MAG: phenylacetic acid degradation protein [Elusimicrobia bacterium RIFOXYB2_FULL_49_7]
MSNQKLIDFFKNDRFATHAGIELLEVRPGYAKATLTIEDRHLNGVNIAQGGALFTLADLAFAAAANAHGTVAVAINVSITFVKASPIGTLLTAEAKENSLNPKIGSYTVNITDNTGDLVAIFQGLAYRKKDRLDIA